MVKLLIQKVEQADSAEKLLDAVKELAAGVDEAAIPTLIQVLAYNNPGAAVAAVDGLIALGEIAVPAILEQLDGYNYGARAWAIRALAGIGDPRALELLLKAAQEDFSLSVRRAAARGLGNILWAKVTPENLLSMQTKVLDALIKASADPEWVVRYAAVVGLENLALSLVQKAVLLEQINQRFAQVIQEDVEIAVRARAKMALGGHNFEKILA